MLIASANESEHREQVKQVFDRLQQYGISINTAKCVFGASTVQYLGYQIDQKGARPVTEKVAAIQNYPKPKDVTELRRFLGMINFYRRFIANAASVQAPLNAFLQGAKKKDKRPITWTEEAEKAFKTCKDSVANAALLAHPENNSPLILTTDASDLACGAALQQQVNGTWEPIAFFSKKFSP